MTVRKKFLWAALSLVAGAFLFTGCKPVEDDDTPELVISGANVVAVGETITLTAQKNNIDSSVVVSWSSSNSAIASITGNNTSCTVKGVADGDVTITAVAGSVEKTWGVKVGAGGSGSGGTGVYADFYNYPTGKVNANGTLTLKNQVASEVLVFTDSVKPENYIGTIASLSSIKVKLTSGKFYNIVAVQKSTYEENPTQATQASKLAYYSDTQGYTVSVSADSLTGSGTWIFNNSTNYWVSIDSVDGQSTYAVIAPKTQRVAVPTQTNKSYDYKIVYKKELKYNDVTLAISEVSRQEQNDTAVFKSTNNYTVTTDLSLSLDSEYDKLAPSVQLINNSGKSIRVYNGNIQVTSFGELESDDYVALDGETAFFTGFTAGASTSAIKIRSTAWTSAIDCTENMTLEKGKVYVITVGKNTSTEAGASPVTWTVAQKEASEIYDTEE